MNSGKIKQLGELFTNKGFNPVIGTIYKQQEKWVNWYRGEVNDFHYYQIKTTGGASVDKKKPSLQMAKKVCEDASALVWNEKSEIIIENDAAQQTLDKVLKDNYFKNEIGTFIELTNMYGTGVIIEYKSKGKTKLNFSYGNGIMVLSYENTTPTEIVVIQEFQKDKMFYTHLTMHLFEDGVYTIEHEMYGSKKEGQLGNKAPLTVLFDEEEVKKMEHIEETDEMTIIRHYIEYETEVPHFQIYKPSIANNFDIASPMGIAKFANSISAFKGVDEAYHSWFEDNTNSRKKIFADDEATRESKQKSLGADGKVQIRSVKYVDKDQTVFQSMSLGEEKLKFYEPERNTEPDTQAIQLNLNLISFKCGFGTNYYSFQDGNVYQNEKNVLSSTSDLFRNRQKEINALREVLINMAYSILYLEKDNGNYKGELNLTYDVKVDDSMIVDDEAKLAKLKAMADSGYISKYLYVMAELRVNEETARKIVSERQEQEDDASFKFINTVENE